jgi:hypothetical protein
LQEKETLSLRERKAKPPTYEALPIEVGPLAGYPLAEREGYLFLVMEARN